MRSIVISNSLFFAVALSSISAQPAEQAKAPSPAEARVFIERVNSESLKSVADASRAAWSAETYITDDTESTTALINEQVTARGLRFVEESHRWDKVALSTDLRREMLLLQLNAPAAPKDPKLLAEETHGHRRDFEYYG
jgi:peptidyl-dipeptidase A